MALSCCLQYHDGGDGGDPRYTMTNAGAGGLDVAEQQLHQHSDEVANTLAGLCDDPFADLPLDAIFDPPLSPSPPMEYYTAAAGEIFYQKTHSGRRGPSLSAPSVLDLVGAVEPFDAPKRQRSCGDLYRHPSIMFEHPNRLAEFVAPPPPPPPPLRSFEGVFGWEEKVAMSVPEQTSTTNNGDSNNVGGVTKTRCLSQQSMAARERRKRISDETMELGRLVPGGEKMNTAEMLRAAYDYVNFLQSQLAVLRCVIRDDSIGGGEEGCRLLRSMLSSMKVHGKLCAEGVCVVPVEAVGDLVGDEGIKSNPALSRDLSRFIDSMESLGGAASRHAA